MRGFLILLGAAILGVGGRYAWSNLSQTSASKAINSHQMVGAKPGQTAHELEETAYYANCDEARAAGKAPLWAGQPGFRPELDPTGTGMACPPTS